MRRSNLSPWVIFPFEVIHYLNWGCFVITARLFGGHSSQ
jgi:hypothetical protein